jgi:hypothetical protein
MPSLAGSTVGGAFVVALVLGVVFAIAAWIYSDARMHVRRGRPIVFSTGAFRLRTPTGWFFASLVMPELIIPLYIDSREFT